MSLTDGSTATNTLLLGEKAAPAPVAILVEARRLPGLSTLLLDPMPPKRVD